MKEQVMYFNMWMNENMDKYKIVYSNAEEKILLTK
jgi:hypothetical protein